MGRMTRPPTPLNSRHAFPSHHPNRGFDMDSVSAMQAWLTRAGLLLQFISLWLVTPQIIGEERLSSMVSDLGTQIARIRALLAISNTSRASYIASGLVGGIGGLGFSVRGRSLV